MAAGEPQEPDDRPHERRIAVAAWCQAIGATLAIATLICSLLSVISAQQAVAIGLPATVLILGGLIAAWMPDPAASRWFGYRTGLQAGALINLCRSLFRRRKNS